MRFLILCIICGCLCICCNNGQVVVEDASNPYEDEWIVEDAPEPLITIEDADDPFEYEFVTEDADDPFAEY